MISIDDVVVKAITPLINDVYRGSYSGSAEEYVVYTYSSHPSDFFDNRPAFELVSIYVELFVPRGRKCLDLRKKIKQQLFLAGFTYPSEVMVSSQNDSADGYQHFSYACNLKMEIDYGKL